MVNEDSYGAFCAALVAQVEAIVAKYEYSAPVVARWADDLYIRLQAPGDDIPLSEIAFAFSLYEDGVWLPPSYATNLHYKLIARLGRSTAGMLGF